MIAKRHVRVTAVLLGLVAGICLIRGVCIAQVADQADAPEVTTVPAVVAPQAEADPEPAQAQESMTMLALIRKGGVVGYLIIALSFVALGLVIDYAVTIRTSQFAPPDQVAAIKTHIGSNNMEEIKKLAAEKSSYLVQVVSAGLHEAHLGYQAMIKAMEDSGEALSAGMARKIEHLNIIANISPMMGLLGTVIGMLRCFNEISRVTGAIDPKQLAGGIFEALVTTCMGLIVAIPSLYFYAIFRNRADEITGETSLLAEELLTAFKKGGTD